MEYPQTHATDHSPSFYYGTHQKPNEREHGRPSQHSIIIEGHSHLPRISYIIRTKSLELWVFIKIEEQLARPDSGPEQNTMSKHPIKHIGFEITRSIPDSNPFRLGSEKKVWSIHRAKKIVEIAWQDSQETASIFVRSRHYPSAFGYGQAEDLTKNRHLLGASQ